jgi:urease accessory protein
MRTLFLLAAVCTPALAHHGEGSKVPGTLVAGAVGGAAHPVLDFAHLGFLLALGVLAWRSQRPFALTAWFGAFTLIGAVAHLGGIEPLAGPWLAACIGATALLAGLAAATKPGAEPGPATWIAVAVAGLLHGGGYAESVEGAAAAVLAVYFAVVMVMQLAIGAIAWQLATRWRHWLAGAATLCGGTAMALAWVQA